VAVGVVGMLAVFSMLVGMCSAVVMARVIYMSIMMALVMGILPVYVRVFMKLCVGPGVIIVRRPLSMPIAVLNSITVRAVGMTCIAVVAVRII